MVNLLTLSDIPTVDPDFDDLELLYNDDVEPASPEEQELYDFWASIDADKLLDKLEQSK